MYPAATPPAKAAAARTARDGDRCRRARRLVAWLLAAGSAGWGYDIGLSFRSGAVALSGRSAEVEDRGEVAEHGDGGGQGHGQGGAGVLAAGERGAGDRGGQDRGETHRGGHDDP